jgi:hypothetical protein
MDFLPAISIGNGRGAFRIRDPIMRKHRSMLVGALLLGAVIVCHVLPLKAHSLSGWLGTAFAGFSLVAPGRVKLPA